jgi:hypothetical protein
MDALSSAYHAPQALVKIPTGFHHSARRWRVSAYAGYQPQTFGPVCPHSGPRERSERAHLRWAFSFDGPFICEHLCLSVAKIAFAVINEICIKFPALVVWNNVPCGEKSAISTQLNQPQPD